MIAIFYTEELSAAYLAAAIGGLAVVWIATKVGVRSHLLYVPLGVVVWYLVLESGVHATLAGVALGFLTPARPYYTAEEFDQRSRAILDQFPVEPDTPAAREHADHEALAVSTIARESVSPLTRAEHALVGWSSFLIVPIFALANAGVDFRQLSIGEALTSSVGLGVAAGLVLGKIIGISLFSFGAVKFRLGKLPPGTGWSQVVGLASVAGIGFTVSLFVTGLAFDDPHLTDLAKVGIFAGSLVAGIIGSVILARAKPPSQL